MHIYNECQARKINPRAVVHESHRMRRSCLFPEALHVVSRGGGASPRAGALRPIDSGLCGRIRARPLVFPTSLRHRHMQPFVYYLLLTVVSKRGCLLSLADYSIRGLSALGLLYRGARALLDEL